MSAPPDRRARRIGLASILLAPVAIAGALLLEVRGDRSELEARAMAMTGGDVGRGRDLFQLYGCVACHALRGIPQARGQVGPPLDSLSRRALIAGKLANNPANLQRWIADPQGVSPGTAMPRLGVGGGDARDLSAFLYSRP